MQNHSSSAEKQIAPLSVVSMLRSRNISRLIARYRCGKRDSERSASGRSREARENRQETLSDVGVIGSPIIVPSCAAVPPSLFVMFVFFFLSYPAASRKRTCSGRGLRIAACSRVPLIHNRGVIPLARRRNNGRVNGPPRRGGKLWELRFPSRS